MAVRSGFFNSVNQDRVYNASEFAEYFATFIGDGVFPNPSTGLQVVEGSNMMSSVRSGKGWIKGYYLVNDSNFNIQHNPSDAVLNRIDRIVMRLDYINRVITINMKTGTPASNPVAPVLERGATVYELALADILIPRGTAAITQQNITDQRFNSQLCGIVKGLVDQIDTTDLFAQYNTSFQTFFTGIQDILDENVAGNLLSMIESLAGEGRTNENVKDNYDVITNHVPTIASSNILGHIRIGQNLSIDSGGQLSNPFPYPTSNFTSNRPPLATDDASKGFVLGSAWITNASDSSSAYICLDNTQNAAIWIRYAINPKGFYYLGDEIVRITGGWSPRINSGTVAQVTNTKQADNLNVVTASQTSSSAISGNFFTNSQVDLTPYSSLEIEWEQIGTPTSNAAQLESAIAVSPAPNINPIDVANKLLIQGPFSRRVSTLNISGINGNNHIAVGASTRSSATSNLRIYAITGVR